MAEQFAKKMGCKSDQGRRARCAWNPLVKIDQTDAKLKKMIDETASSCRLDKCTEVGLH
jgi:hypothetical protein